MQQVENINMSIEALTKTEKSLQNSVDKLIERYRKGIDMVNKIEKHGNELYNNLSDEEKALIKEVNSLKNEKAQLKEETKSLKVDQHIESTKLEDTREKVRNNNMTIKKQDEEIADKKVVLEDMRKEIDELTLNNDHAIIKKFNDVFFHICNTCLTYKMNNMTIDGKLLELEIQHATQLGLNKDNAELLIKTLLTDYEHNK